MPDFHVILPSKPRIISEDDRFGVYEIEGFYPGYGHTIGNSLRRIIYSSLPGAAITAVRIEGVNHEFSTIEGMKEDVITLLLNLKKVRFKLEGDEPRTARLQVKGIKDVTAGDITITGQLSVHDQKQHIATLTSKNATLDIALTIEKGLGYVPKEALHKDKVDIGAIVLDASFTPVRRVNYEVENMRVGNRTDFNRLKISLETDGTITPREALEQSIMIMINQLKAIVGFKEEEIALGHEHATSAANISDKSNDSNKIKIENVGFSARTTNALIKGGLRTLGGLARKSVADLMEIEGLGEKAIKEIEDTLEKYELKLRNK